MAPIKGFDPLARAVLRAQPDARLVALAREGREAAFEEIVRRYRPALVAFATAYAPPAVAEDVVQESLVRSWRALRESSTEIRLRPWLYTIVRNGALNARRDARPHAELDESFDGVRQPPEIVLTQEELERAVASVQALPEAQREALVRSAIDGRAHDQIAAELGTSVGAVRQLIFRARATLRHAAGLFVPLPVLRALIEADATEAGAGAVAAGGSAAAASTLAVAGGGSIGAKGLAIVAAAVAAAGSGIAIERAVDGGSDGPGAQPANAAGLERGSGDGGGESGVGGASGDESSSRGHSGEDGDDGSGGGGDEGPDGDGPGSGDDRDDDDSGEGGDGSSGPGGGEDSEDFDTEAAAGDGSGTSGSSGWGSSGSGSSELESSGSGSSGSGSDGSGSSGSDSSGSGSGSSGSGSSGSGSGGSDSSGSGSSGSDSSGSGSGDVTELDDSSGSGSSGSG